MQVHSPIVPLSQPLCLHFLFRKRSKPQSTSKSIEDIITASRPLRIMHSSQKNSSNAYSVVQTVLVLLALSKELWCLPLNTPKKHYEEISARLHRKLFVRNKAQF